MEREKKVVLVAGGAGYIGSHTVVELVEAGYEVVIVDNLSNSEFGAVLGVRSIVGRDVAFVQADCSDSAAMEDLFSNYRFDAVIHFAAFKAVGESVGAPLKYLRNNLDSLMVIIDTMRGHGVGNLLFSSSCTVYGQPDSLPVTESTERKQAESPYGYTKQVSEDIISQCVSAYDGFSAIALRYFNPIGAHRSSLIGELPLGVPGNLIPYITQTAAGIRERLSIFGDDYPTCDGSAVRDYIDVVDLAKAHLAAVGRMVGGRQKSPYEVFNVGTGRGVSVLQIVREFERVNNIELPYQIVERRAGDIVQIWADTSLSNRELGWSAQSELGETLASAWAWQCALDGRGQSR